MRRLLAPWLLLLVAISGGVAATYVRCPGCIERDRLDSTCEWTTGDTKFPLDSKNPEHQQHLIADAQLAEELAIRYADAEDKRLLGFYGHGGLIDHGRVRNECMARLVTTIENDHTVTPEQVAIARGRRNRMFDLAVGLLFVPLYLFGATVACRRLYRRFSSNERYVGLVATSAASIAASFFGLQLLQLWLMVWETVRVGNRHMSSFRAATWNHWSQQHFDAQFMCGLLLFWLVALLCYQLVSDEHSAVVRSPQGVLLR